MLPNCCHNLSGAPLMMLIWCNCHLKLKKDFQMWSSRFWVVGRSQCCRCFFGGPPNRTCFLRNIKNIPNMLWVDQIHHILANLDDFCLKFAQIFRENSEAEFGGTAWKKHVSTKSGYADHMVKTILRSTFLKKYKKTQHMQKQIKSTKNR